jgi:P27 family predicted phage terminase small subunit
LTQGGISVAGPPPKPTQLKVLQGNPGKRPLNKREPQPRAAHVSCPRWLLPEAKKEWRRLAPELRRLGLLTVVDRTALAAYCQAYARWRQAEEVLTREGLVFETASGYLMPRPEVAIAQKSQQIMKGFLTEFGFTPASRTRVSLPEQKAADPFAEFLQRGKTSGE